MLKRLVYIGSVGYSGSTLLDMILGGNEKVTSLGEVYLLSRYLREGSNCTCGMSVESCPFWLRVQERFMANHEEKRDLSELDLGADRITQSLFRKFPRLADVGLILGNDLLWESICRVNKNAQIIREAAKDSVALFESVCDVEGSEIIVDSSKYALPLKARYMELKNKLRVIYLVRDGRAVSKSLVKRNGVSFSHASKLWARQNWNLQMAMKSIPNSQVYWLKYEDLCSDPELVLNQLKAFIGTDIPLEINPIEKGNYHNIGGNPMRYRRSETTICLNERWKQEITNEEIDIFNRYGGKLNASLGYS